MLLGTIPYNPLFISVSGATSESFEINVASAAPGLFSANLGPTGVAAAEILRIAPDGTGTRELAFELDIGTRSYTER